MMDRNYIFVDINIIYMNNMRILLILLILLIYHPYQNQYKNYLHLLLHKSIFLKENFELILLPLDYPPLY